MDPQNMCFELYTKYMEKVNGSKVGQLNLIPIPLCVMAMICTLAPDKNSRYIGFWYAYGKMISQLDASQLEYDKVFCIQMELLHENMGIFIENSRNPSAREISNSEKHSTLRQLDACFKNVNSCIKTMQYSYDSMEGMCWVHTNKIKFEKSKVGEKEKHGIDSEICSIIKWK